MVQTGSLSLHGVLLQPVPNEILWPGKYPHQRPLPSAQQSSKLPRPNVLRHSSTKTNMVRGPRFPFQKPPPWPNNPLSPRHTNPPRPRRYFHYEKNYRDTPKRLRSRTLPRRHSNKRRKNSSRKTRLRPFGQTRQRPHPARCH